MMREEGIEESYRPYGVEDFLTLSVWRSSFYDWFSWGT
jgi:hypothetical protein